jgi:cyclopropane fatty-acyl-phospholipid synthase-like methyltransferase
LYYKISNILKVRKKSHDYISDSASYWEQRYLNNKNSGAGSYGRLANFKAEIINAFVVEHHVKDVIEFGCGDGHQLSLANYPKYTGVDVSTEAVSICKKLYKADSSKSFYTLNEFEMLNLKAELVLSLDVIFHLIEDEVYNNYMQQLFSTSQKFVIIYSSNNEKYYAKHVKSRKFTNWIDAHVANNWHLKHVIKNKFPYDRSNPNDTSFSDFFIYQKY